jgi:hypothetical protein
MRLRVRASLVVAAVMFVSGVAVFAADGAHADQTFCRNETPITTGDDFFIDIGPGVLFVGIDKGDQAGGTPVENQSAWVCLASSIAGFDVIAGVDRGDLPRVVPGAGCFVNVDGTCRLSSFSVYFDDGDFAQVVRVEASGLPAGNGVTQAGLPVHCVGFGEVCS